MAAGIPAFEQRRVSRVKHTVPEVTAPFASLKDGTPEIALHRAQTHPDLRHHGRGRPALAVQGPDLRMQRLPACLTLRRTLPRRQGDVVGWHGHGHRPIGQRHGLLAYRLIDRVEDVTRRDERLVPRFPEILQQMQAVRDLSQSDPYLWMSEKRPGMGQKRPGMSQKMLWISQKIMVASSSLLSLWRRLIP
jgi:hypothetical protein